MNVIDYFPRSLTPRPHQVDVIERAALAYNAGKQVVIVAAPTGTGKSFIGFVLSKYLGSSYYTTPLNSLVDQIMFDEHIGDKVTALKGKVRYSCLLKYEERGRRPPFNLDIEEKDSNMSCFKAKCMTTKNYNCRYRVLQGKDQEHVLDEPEIKSTDCYYYRARDRALISGVVVMPLALLLTSRYLRKRNLVVVDECHGLESWLQKMVSITIKDLKGTIPESMVEAIIILEERIRKATILYNMLEEESGSRNLSEKEYNQLEESIEIIEKGGQVVSDYKNGIPWVPIVIKENDNTRSLSFKPVVVEKYGNLIWNKGHKVLLMSATPFPHEFFAKSVGINPKDVEFIDVPSVFPSKNTEFINAGIGKLSQSGYDINIKHVMRRIGEILEREKGKRGLIHCFSYKIQKYIQDNISPNYSDRLVFHNSSDRNFILKSWIMSGRKDSVLVSVNMGEGLDLPDDLCRFMILVKCPYANIGDNVVKARLQMEDGRKWYTTQTLRDIVQMSGRATRHKDDFCRIYVLDSDIIELVHRNRKEMPVWFMDSWKLMKPMYESEVVTGVNII